MKAVTGTLPADDGGWAFEVKWDGVRILAAVDRDGTKLRSSNGIDVTGRYPEMQALVETVGDASVIIDGEVVAFDDEGRPSFGRLQHRMHVGGAAEVQRRIETVPVTYVVFDILEFDGNELITLPYTDRRRVLTEFLEDDGCWTVPGHRVGDAESLLRAVTEQG